MENSEARNFQYFLSHRSFLCQTSSWGSALAALSPISLTSTWGREKGKVKTIVGEETQDQKVQNFYEMKFQPLNVSELLKMMKKKIAQNYLYDRETKESAGISQTPR